MTWARSGRGRPGPLLGGRREKDPPHFLQFGRRRGKRSPLPTGWREAGKEPPLPTGFVERPEKLGSRHGGGGGKCPHFLRSICGNFFSKSYGQGRRPDCRCGSASHASRDGRSGTAALRGAEVTPAGALVMAGAWGGGAVPGPWPPLGPCSGVRRGAAAAQPRPGSPPTPEPARAGPERAGSVKSAGGSLTRPGRHRFGCCGRQMKRQS